MSAPTEAEIRAAIVDNVQERHGGAGDAIDELVRAYAGPVSNPAFLAGAGEEYEPDRPDPGDLWTDLRSSEAARLHELVSEARQRIDERIRAIVVDELVAAGVAFASEYPNAPRPAAPVA